MIESKLHDDILTITLCRPEKANALTEDMLLDIAAAVQAHSKARALILTGQGRVFSAGADLALAGAGLAISPAWEKASRAIADFQGLSIAMLNGTVAGGAFGMVLACDLRIAVPGANFFYPVMEKGYLPQPSDPGRLVSLIGPARAKMILMAGQKIPARQALEWGLVDQLHGAEELPQAVDKLLTAARSTKHSHIKAIKSMIG